MDIMAPSANLYFGVEYSSDSVDHEKVVKALTKLEYLGVEEDDEELEEDNESEESNEESEGEESADGEEQNEESDEEEDDDFSESEEVLEAIAQFATDHYPKLGISFGTNGSSHGTDFYIALREFNSRGGVEPISVKKLEPTDAHKEKFKEFLKEVGFRGAKPSWKLSVTHD